MIKRIVLFLLQLLSFGALMWIGGFWDVLHLQAEVTHSVWASIPVFKYPVSSTHILIADGLIFAGVLLLIILLLQALARRLRPWAALSVVAYIIAAVVTLALKVGLPPAS
ncbi:MAG TPA: hypothetical protein VHY48_12200 [Acidobacteriaceae bacterium]|nr:hypothetical protein [Acidobacteriaceae bacterium]